MTEIELRQGTVAIARTYLGIQELGTEHRAMTDYYNDNRRPGDYRMQYADPWCAEFTSFVGMKAVEKYGLSCKPYELIPSSASCDAKIAEYKRLGLWVEDDDYLPTPGDEIFYDWQDSGAGDNKGSSDHVGLVADVNGTGITVIEGNKSDMVAYRTIPPDARNIRGYGIPDYGRWAATSGAQQGGAVVLDRPEGAVDMSGDSAQTEPTSPAEPEQTGTGHKTCKPELPELRRGDGLDDPDETVCAAQLLLIGRGFRCGFCGADGEFGEQTELSVIRFQFSRNLPETGVIDALTWAALLGVAGKFD